MACTEGENVKQLLDTLLDFVDDIVTRVRKVKQIISSFFNLLFLESNYSTSNCIFTGTRRTNFTVKFADWPFRSFGHKCQCRIMGLRSLSITLF
jgi:hypothetical protein